MEAFANNVFTLVFFTFTLYLTLYVLFSFGEVLYPAEKGQSIRGRVRNIFITLIYLILGMTAFVLLSSFSFVEARAIGNFNTATNISIILFFMFVADFFYYWYHRAQHTLPWLWPIHEIHHADTELNVTTSYRTYWLEIPIQAAVVSLPASLIIGDLGALMLITTTTLIMWEFFTHANLRLHLSFLSPIICGPQVHRIHHSRLPEHFNKNFAQYFPIFDVLFGTYYPPKRNEFPPTGSHHLQVDAPLSVTTLTHPFREWFRTIRQRRKKQKTTLH